MKALAPRALSAVVSVLLVLVPASTGAQQRLSGIQVSPPPPQGHMHGLRGFPVFVVERQYVPIVEREIIREVPAPLPPAPPVSPRKSYVIGASYSSLPGGCMKLIENGAAYYLCSGEWYRKVGAGRGGPYKAVEHP